jgi:hypothetical protein
MVIAGLLRDLVRGRDRNVPEMLSVVVNFYNNRREAKNTLYSLTREYQWDAKDIPYEVIALDNGSTQPLSESEIRSFGPEFHHRFVSTQSVSPVQAINAACREATGERLLVMIDGAHIVTPRIFRLVHDAFRRFPAPFVATVPFYLGPTKQNLSVQAGYNHQVEDELLQASGWKQNGYRLYSVSASFADESGGWYGQLFESCCFAIRKVDYLALGGFDERFQSRGGGLTNLDIFQRALVRQELEYVVLLGEATFHQVHGGVSTNVPMEQHPWNEFHQEFKRIRGHAFMRVPRKPILLGDIPQEAARAAEFSRKVGGELWDKIPPLIP